MVGDYDNDGDPDVYLCNYGGNVLYRNRGDGTFQDVTGPAGVGYSGWSTAGPSSITTTTATLTCM